MKLDLLLFGRVRPGPFFALLVERTRASAADEDPLLRHRPDRARHDGRIGPRARRSPKAWPRSGTRCTSLVDAGPGPFPAGAGALASRWRRRSAAGTCAGCATERGARASRARIRPDVVIERYYNFGGEGDARGAGGSARWPCSRSTRRSIDYPGSPKARLDRALLVEPMRRWRERHLPRWPTSSSRRARRSCPRRSAATADRRARVGRRHRPLPPGRRRARAVRAAGPARWSRCSPARSAAGTARSTSSTAMRDAARARARRTSARCSSATARSCRACAGGGRGPRRRRSSPARVPHDRMPACLAAADIGVAPFDVGAHAPLSLGFYWSPLKIFEYMAAGLPVVAPAIDRHRVARRRRPRRRALRSAAHPAALADALERSPTATLRRRLGAAARARAVRDYSWAAHCRALDAAIRARCGARSR